MNDVYTSDDLNIFRNPVRIIIAGVTGSGKTQFTTSLVKKYGHIFKDIYVCGLTSHPLENDENLNTKIILSKDICNPLDSFTHPDPSNHTLLILDDVFNKAVSAESVSEAFTRGRHHLLSVILITQNIFFPGKYSRNISLNASHFVLFRIRDNNQVECLARQCFGKNKARKVLEIYNHVISQNPHAYLLVDLNLYTPPKLQFRTNITASDACEVVFINE